MAVGWPRLHLRSVGSTSDRARELALAGAPHGAIVTAAEQTAGRGRQGRSWAAQPGAAVLVSMVIREPSGLLPLVAAVAVAETIGDGAAIKWPNDVLCEGRKVAGILAEGRPHEGWAVLGIGVNVAIDVALLPDEVRERAGSLGRSRGEVEPFLGSLLGALDRWLAAPMENVLDAWRARDALVGREVSWAGGSGVAGGVDGEGQLLVVLDGGGRVALNAGEVQLRPWLIRIAHNLAANLYRDRSRKPQTPIEDSDTTLRATHTTEDLVEGRDELARILEGVKDLPDDRREALIMRFALGMDNREIARAMGKTDGATKVLLHRAIKQLEEIVATRQGSTG
jgi:BirA family transcriptional regulator, biotin operon repressor / biotin---[acetyl-CoA-carboxylase] ligase